MEFIRVPESLQPYADAAWKVIDYTWLQGNGLQTDVGFISYASMLAATIGAGVLIPVMWYIGVSSVAKYNLPTLVGGYTKKIRESITKRMSSSPKKSSPSPKKSVSPKRSKTPMKAASTGAKKKKAVPARNKSVRSSTPMKKSTAMKKK